jgi:two-component system, OmpR family, response regulator RpaA
MMATILVIDDNHAITELVKINLDLLGHNVLVAYDGIKGFALAQQEAPALIILDVMMPNVDGYTVAQRLRKASVTEHTPILMLTALGDIDNKVQGFDAGVDDYLTKPFELPELTVRVRALLRRTGTVVPSLSQPELLSAGDLTLVPDNLEVHVRDQLIKLTPTEFEILNCLLQHHGTTLSLGKLLQDVWGYSPDDDVETIRVHVRHLRAKLEKVVPDRVYIETVYGGGYRLAPEGKPKASKPSAP